MGETSVYNEYTCTCAHTHTPSYLQSEKINSKIPKQQETGSREQGQKLEFFEYNLFDRFEFGTI